jgi:tetratricopeptide (TPR) repeat protein
VLDGLTGLIEIGKAQYDSAATLIAVQRTSQNPQVRARANNLLSTIALVHGRLADAARLRAEGRSENAARGVGTPLDQVLDEAWGDAWFREQYPRAVAKLDSALARTPLRTLAVDSRNDFRIASLYALAHRPDRARAVLAQYDAEVKDTTIRRFQEPLRHGALAEIAIAEGRPRDAVDEIRRSDRRPDGPVDGCQPCADAALARVYDLAAMPDSAIATFERYLATTFWNRLDLRADPAHYAGAHKRLGELYEAKGEKQKAVSHYMTFLELWKNADPELQPRVAEVRQRLARLGDIEKR